MYPRQDVIYKAKSSFNFETAKAKIYMKRNPSKWVGAARWGAHALVGVGTGTFAFLMATVEETLTAKRSETTQDLLSDNSDWGFALAFYIGFGLVCALVAGLMTVYIGPGATGSGVAEIMGLLNGVNYPKTIGVWTLVVKIVAVVLAVVGSLCVGKEGPLAHIGAVTAMLVIYMPIDTFKFFQNDHDKRTFIAAGAAAGVSAAFGSPIGGALFAFEISKPTTFWTFSVLWLVFITSAISTLTLAMLTTLREGGVLSLSSAAVLKFGTLDQIYSPIADFPAALIIGAACGILGAIFIDVNTRMGILRKKYVNNNCRKVFEVCFFSFITAAAFFFVAMSSSNCQKKIDDVREYYAF